MTESDWSVLFGHLATAVAVLVVVGRYGTKCGDGAYSRMSVVNDVRIVLRYVIC